MARYRCASAQSDGAARSFTSIIEVMLWCDLHRLQERYVVAIDFDRLEEWPDFFTEKGVYEIVPKENADCGLPMAIMHCFGRPMMRERIFSLRQVNVFEPHTYRHVTSGLEFTRIDQNTKCQRRFMFSVPRGSCFLVEPS